MEDSFIIIKNPDAVRKLFEEYKKHNHYAFRMEQSKYFRPFAKEIISEVLRNGKTNNEILYSFSQLFGANCSIKNFNKYCEKLPLSKEKKEYLSAKFNELFEQNCKGYTTPPQGGRPRLSTSQLGKVEGLLRKVLSTNNTNLIIATVKEFENDDVPRVKHGTFSPWLNYLQPKICPIFNRGPEEFIKEIGLTKKLSSYSNAIEIFQTIKNAAGIDDLGIIDSYISWGSDRMKKLARYIEAKPTDNKEQRNNQQKINPVNKSIPKNMSTSSNLILYGPPGTGKTYKTIDIAVSLINEEAQSIEDTIHEIDEEKHNRRNKDFLGLAGRSISFVTFHQNYSYEQFVGGLTPVEHDKGLIFKWKPGIFLTACAKAYFFANPKKDKSDSSQSEEMQFLDLCNDIKDIDSTILKAPKYVLIIDEVNRANISRVFGELITLIEDDKRIGGKHQMILSLPNGKKFGVPANLVILGTMNTADKSIALVDIALRRRFEFISMYPNYELMDNLEWKKNLESLNENIRKEKRSPDFQIGHSYFMNENGIDEIMNKKVIPLLVEYFPHTDLNKIMPSDWQVMEDERGVIVFKS